jgi:hypothetical protein
MNFIRFMLLSTSVGLTACGDSGSSSSESNEVFGTVSVENASDTRENGTVTFNRSECSREVTTGYFQAKLGNQSGLEALTIKIKDFTTANQTYTCVQTADNKVAPELGGLYTGCAIEFRKKSATNPSSFSGYGMYRDESVVTSLDYQGTCTIKVSYSAPKVDMSLSCTQMIQTYYEGGRRYPIMPNVVASIGASSSVYCRLP